MVRTYKLKSDKKRCCGSSLPENLAKAVAAVNAGMSLRKACEEYNVKKSTLHDKIKGKHPKKHGKSVNTISIKYFCSMLTF